MKPNILLAIPPRWYPTVLSAPDLERLGKLGHLINPTLPVDQGPSQESHNVVSTAVDHAFLMNHIGTADIVVTSWDTPNLDAGVIANAPRLKLVCHAAGSVRSVVSDALWDRGRNGSGSAQEHRVRVTSSAAAIAHGVAEFCLGLILSCTKRVPWFATGTRAGLWQEPVAAFGGAFEIYQQKIGVIGAGHIGRHLIHLLQSFSCEVVVYDPYLTPDAARALNATKAETLEELFASCRVVSLNAPTNEGTRGMLRGHHFAALRPGSLFINTAGSIQICEEEFLAELRKGRFVACIDRCELEPVELDHPYRTLPNVLLTPHIAGAIAENQFRIGTLVADEVEAFVHGRPLRHEVTREALEKMA